MGLAITIPAAATTIDGVTGIQPLALIRAINVCSCRQAAIA
jgi:hypothetical protein